VLEELLEQAIGQVIDIDLYNAELQHEARESAELDRIRVHTYEFLSGQSQT
jgi:hypothetical protein